MRHEITIICDDIRQETGNKLSLMGIYDDAVLVQGFPVRLPKICMFQRWRGTSLKRNETIRIEIEGKPLSEKISSDLRPETDHFNPAATKAQILLVFAPFDILRAGEIYFLTYFGGSEEPAYRYTIDIRSGLNA